MPLTRRVLLASPLLLTAQTRAPAPPQNLRVDPPTAGPTLTHRGYTVDIALAATMPNRAAIEASLKRQIDIPVDCGAKPEIMAVFQKQKLKLKTESRLGPGRY